MTCSPQPAASAPPRRGLVPTGAHVLARELGDGSGFESISVAFALVALLSALTAAVLRLLGPRRALAALLVIASRTR